MENIWKQLKVKADTENKAFTVLAPMEDVTDVVFRQIVQQEGRPDLFFTEFTNCDGLQSRGRERVIHRFDFLPDQKPIIAQIWGKNPETYVLTIPTIIEMGFQGVDINMGCPVDSVVKNGAGGGLIREQGLALEIIHSVKESIDKANVPGFAFSVKTRVGLETIDLTWIELLLKQNLDALSVHLRTVSEQSKVPAHWELMPQIIAAKNVIAPETAIVGNGDITTKEQLKTYRHMYGIDGLMIGRGIFENLWLFSDTKDDSTIETVERLSLLKQHLQLYENRWGRQKNFEMMKKFFKVYLRNFDASHQLRNDLNQLKTVEEMIPAIDQWISSVPTNSDNI